MLRKTVDMLKASAPQRHGATSRHSLRKLGVLVVSACAIGALAGPATGQASNQPVIAIDGSPINLNITPKRLVLDRGNRAGTVYIFNQGKAAATFDISLVERVMVPNGEIKSVEEARSDPQLQSVVGRLASAQSMLVATPRRVTLAPGKGQTIRVRVMKPTVDQVERRTHLTVASVPPRDSGVTAEQAQSNTAGQLGFRVTSIFGLSVPVIIRPAVADARGAIENVRLGFAELSPDGVGPVVRTPVIRVDLRRTGASSLFGNIEVNGARGREVVGLARGVGVYTEIDRRMLQLPLRRAPAKGEQLTVTFTDDDARPGQVIARAQITAD